ncbi:MAG TPA: MFS transporter, partial [Caldilineaceae bacterium]|nr:MFS transporter [Caldilineaceae bacterium]
MTRLFYRILANTLAASITNTFVWFSVTFWVYLQTRSVIATSVMAGIYTLTVAFSGFLLGSLVDRYPKKTSMALSSLGSLVCYALAGLVYITTPSQRFADPASLPLWLFIVFTLAGALVGNLRGIALSTLVTILFPEGQRDKANGLVGTTTGVSFLVASILGGMVIGFVGVAGMLGGAMALTLLVLVHLWTLTIPDHTDRRAGVHTLRLDLSGTIRTIRQAPGLFGLLFFQSFNNFLSGVFMALMDAYGLELVSVQVWGALWGFLSLAFIFGGLVVARRGLGPNPLRTLFRVNIVTWTICMLFTLQSSIVLFAAGVFIYLCLMPAVEAAEQTILQKVIPP